MPDGEVVKSAWENIVAQGVLGALVVVLTVLLLLAIRALRKAYEKIATDAKAYAKELREGERAQDQGLAAMREASGQLTEAVQAQTTELTALRAAVDRQNFILDSTVRGALLKATSLSRMPAVVPEQHQPRPPLPSVPRPRLPR